MNPRENQIKTHPNNEEEDEGHIMQYAMQLVNASVLPMTLKACIDLNVLEIIHQTAPNSLSSSQIASHLHCHNPEFAAILLDRMLSLLASFSILNCSSVGPTRLYSLGPVSKYFLPNENGFSLAPVLQANQDKVIMDMWYHMKEAVIEGNIPFNRAYGMSASEYIVNENPSYFRLFKESMSNYNAMFVKKMLESYRGFEGLESVVDVGGGDGSILNAIVEKYPKIKGVNFDLPKVVEKKDTYPGKESSQCQLLVNERYADSGVVSVSSIVKRDVAIDGPTTLRKLDEDSFISRYRACCRRHVCEHPKGDAIFLKWMLHSWDDENCVKILKICYKALPDHGKVIVVELVLPEAPESTADVRSKLQFDLMMMNMNPGGKERTQTDFRILAEAAGFSTVTVEFSVYSFSLLELYK